MDSVGSATVGQSSREEVLAISSRLPHLDRELMAFRASQELKDGMYCNLGIGIPTLLANWIGDLDVVLQSEIGMLKTGPLASREEEDQDLINAGSQGVTELPGCSYFNIVESFSMIRGGCIDTAVLGAFQVSEQGDLASWNNPARGLGKLGGIGGSMDLAVGAKRVIVVMEHVTNDGELRILKKCTYPLTGKGCVDLIITDLAVIEVTRDGLVLREVMPGVTAEDIQALTGPTLVVADDLKEMAL